MSQKWILKAMVQKTISYLPYPQRINYFFQKHVTKGVELSDEYFEQKLQHAKDHCHYLNKFLDANPNTQILELGTGWYPIIPLYFYLSDSGNVISIDIQKWMKREHQLRTINKFIVWNNRGILQDYFEKINPAKWKEMVQIYNSVSDYSLEDISRTIGLQYYIQDARDLQFDSNSIDFICSNNTLEHIRVDHLKPILNEFKRVLSPNGVMSHFIDMSDHFAHFDHSITIYNFLKYSKKHWRLIDNNIQHLNRLRFVDYTSLYKELGIPIIEEDIRPGNIEELRSIKIHKEFSEYSESELAVSHCYLISKISS
jgi:cyclopropane fatty-acyl-phospholipid synthase-like methyltransferase